MEYRHGFIIILISATHIVPIAGQNGTNNVICDPSWKTLFTAVVSTLSVLLLLSLAINIYLAWVIRRNRFSQQQGSNTAESKTNPIPRVRAVSENNTYKPSPYDKIAPHEESPHEEVAHQEISKKTERKPSRKAEYVNVTEYNNPVDLTDEKPAKKVVRKHIHALPSLNNNVPVPASEVTDDDDRPHYHQLESPKPDDKTLPNYCQASTGSDSDDNACIELYETVTSP